MNDLRQACRQMLKHAGFSAIVVMTLTLALGANSALFALFDAVWLRPPPFEEPERLVRLFNSYPKAGKPRSDSSLLQYFHRREGLGVLSRVAALRRESAVVGEPGATELEEVLRVSPEFLDTLGVRPQIGHGFSEKDSSLELADVIIVSDECWRAEFQSDPSVIGRTLRVDGVDRTVVGVLPEGFRYLSSRPRLLMPLYFEPDARRLGRLYNSAVDLVGRLAPGVSLEECQARVDAHDATAGRDFPQAAQVAEAGFRTRVVSLWEDYVEAARPVVLLLQAGVFCLLLIAGANVVNLVLIRTHGRLREVAIRRALGARSWHVAMQIVVEIGCLFALGGIGGITLGAVGLQALENADLQLLPVGVSASMNERVVGVTFLMGIALAIPCATLAAWYALSGGNRSGHPRETWGASHAVGPQRLRHGIVVGQVAVAFVLLSAAGLLGLSFWRLSRVSPGFRPENVLVGRLLLPGTTYPNPQAKLDFAVRLLAKMETEPGVGAGGIITHVPIERVDDHNVMTVPGYPPTPGAPPRLHPRYGVAGKYFAAMGIPLLAGRFLETTDSFGASRACVVDEAFAKHYWPGEEPLGKRLFEGPTERNPEEAFTVVGIVGAVKHRELSEPAGPGVVYFPYRHHASQGLYAVVRTGPAPETFHRRLRQWVAETDPELPLTQVRTMTSRLNESLLGHRSPAWLAALFSGVALLLSATGTYGVLAFSVAQRRGEIGIRMALGALRSQIATQFLTQAFRLVGCGLVLGSVATIGLGETLDRFLYGVPAWHPGTLASMALVVLATGILAALAPSLRAARTDPIRVLRAE